MTMPITYFDYEGNALHPDDEAGRCFVQIEDYEDVLFDLEQLRKAIKSTAEECAKLVAETK